MAQQHGHMCPVKFECQLLPLTPGVPLNCLSRIWIPGQFIISPLLEHTHKPTAQTCSEHTPCTHLFPRRPYTIHHSLPLTVTDGSARHWHYPTQRLIWLQQHTDSWSNMSSGGETVAINNLSHVMGLRHGRHQAAGRCHPWVTDMDA